LAQNPRRRDEPEGQGKSKADVKEIIWGDGPKDKWERTRTQNGYTKKFVEGGHGSPPDDYTIVTVKHEIGGRVVEQRFKVHKDESIEKDGDEYCFPRQPES